MDKFSKGFTVFILSVLKILLVVLFFVSIGTFFNVVKQINMNGIIVLGIFLVAIICGYYTIKTKKLSNNKKVILILLIACALRVLWLLNVNSVPNSDFKTMYVSAQSFLQGDRSMFWGSAYIARFPHLTMMVLYMALIIKVFPNPLVAMKVFNLFYGVVSVFLIYLIVKAIFNSKKKAMCACLIAAIFPPLITYTATFCTENVAIPFYLLSLYLFIKVVKEKKHWLLLFLCGIILAVGNLFRMVATVMVIAYCMYILIYTKEDIKCKLRNAIIIVVSYGLIVCSVSGILQVMKITENSLWRGSEPAITSILKGTHYESGGRWNEEDAALPEACNYDYDEIEKRSQEIIKERLTTTPASKLAYFYLRKFTMQWNEGDLSGAFWSQLDAKEDEIVLRVDGGSSWVFQIIYTIVIVLMIVGTFNKKKISEIKELNLFYIILCGYGATYLITESQPRYSYIVCWIFILLGMIGLDFIFDKLNIKEG